VTQQFDKQFGYAAKADTPFGYEPLARAMMEHVAFCKVVRKKKFIPCPHTQRLWRHLSKMLPSQAFGDAERFNLAAAIS
jgi:hypothetical protein